jgi:hypothetical protein
MLERGARLSRKFRDAARLSATRHYVLARVNNVHPTTFSKWLNGARDVCRDDPRVLAIGRMIGVADAAECFEPVETAVAPNDVDAALRSEVTQ